MMELVGAEWALSHLRESFPPDGTGRKNKLWIKGTEASVAWAPQERDTPPTSVLASKQTPMGLCHERQHLYFWKEISDGLISCDIGAGHSSLWNDTHCPSVLMQCSSMCLRLAPWQPLLLFPIPSLFPTALHRSPEVLSRALYAKRRKVEIGSSKVTQPWWTGCLLAILKVISIHAVFTLTIF